MANPTKPRAVGLAPKDFSRVAQALKRSERAYRNDGTPTPPPYPALFPFLIPAKATAGITHKTTASVTLCDPETGNGKDTVQVYNPYKKADCPANALVWITPGNGKYYAVVWDCDQTFGA